MVPEELGAGAAERDGLVVEIQLLVNDRCNMGVVGVGVVLS